MAGNTTQDTKTERRVEEMGRGQSRAQFSLLRYPPMTGRWYILPQQAANETQTLVSMHPGALSRPYQLKRVGRAYLLTAHLKAYAAGSLLLFIPALFMRTLSCLRLASHPAPSLPLENFGPGEAKIAMRRLFSSLSSHEYASCWTAERALKSEFVICSMRVLQ